MTSRILCGLAAWVLAACSADTAEPRVRVALAAGTNPQAGTARVYISSFDNSIPARIGDPWLEERLRVKLDGAYAMVPGIDGEDVPAPVGDMAFDVAPGTRTAPRSQR